MSEEKSIEILEMDCAEEGRRARLMVEWVEVNGERRLKGVQCDNPRFEDLANWQCEWSCWEKVKKLKEAQSED
jgi:hypothetical protein